MFGFGEVVFPSSSREIQVSEFSIHFSTLWSEKERNNVGKHKINFFGEINRNDLQLDLARTLFIVRNGNQNVKLELRDVDLHNIARATVGRRPRRRFEDDNTR